MIFQNIKQQQKRKQLISGNNAIRLNPFINDTKRKSEEMTYIHNEKTRENKQNCYDIMSEIR